MSVIACATCSPADTPPDAVPDTIAPVSQEVAPDTAQAADTTDTYFEGSRRVWEAARDRGVTFRAVGQEPGWLLEIEGDLRLTLVTDYGADTLTASVPTPVTDAASRTVTYHAVEQGRDLRISIREEPCEDTMSGERFSRTVAVVVNGAALQGCGRSLDRLK